MSTKVSKAVLKKGGARRPNKNKGKIQEKRNINRFKLSIINDWNPQPFKNIIRIFLVKNDQIKYQIELTEKSGIGFIDIIKTFYLTDVNISDNLSQPEYPKMVEMEEMPSRKPNKMGLKKFKHQFKPFFQTIQDDVSLELQTGIGLFILEKAQLINVPDGFLVMGNLQIKPFQKEEKESSKTKELVAALQNLDDDEAPELIPESNPQEAVTEEQPAKEQPTKIEDSEITNQVVPESEPKTEEEDQQKDLEDPSPENEKEIDGVKLHDINLVIEQTKCTQEQAIKALKNNKDDIVLAIMELTM